MTTMLGNGLCKLMKWVPKEDYDIDNNDMYAPGADLNEQPPLYTSTVTPDKDRQDNVENNQFIKPQKELQPPSRRGSHLSMKKTGQFKCDFEGCGKICFDRASLKKHMQIHGARQYVCTYEGCGKKFQDSSKLKRHYLTHTGEKKHICTICNKVSICAYVSLLYLQILVACILLKLSQLTHLYRWDMNLISTFRIQSW